MANNPFTLFAGQTHWQWGSTRLDVDGNAPAEQIAGALKTDGYNGEGILLAIPSAWCLCASVRTTGLPARNRQQALTYRLEEKLPLAAEDVIADFVPFTSNEAQTLGVCVERKQLSPWVESLEAAGVAIAAVCPAALLALQQMLPVVGAADAVVLPSADGLDLFILRDGKPRAWYWMGHDAAELRRHLAVEFHQQSKPVTIAVGEINPEIQAALGSYQLTDTSLLDARVAATSLASTILFGKTTAWIDLRRDGLAASDPLRAVRAPLTFALASVAICVLCLCGAMLWRANQYDQLASRHADQQQEVFRRAFPNDAAPMDVLSRLTAEQRKLHGLSGDASAPAQQNGLITLRELITHLPAADELRYRVLELRLDLNQFTLEGQTPGHGDADLIASSLRKGGLFKVDAPKTEQLGDGGDAGGEAVTFTITGGLPSALKEPTP